MKFIWSITECFAIIIIGYFSGKFGLISNHESNGISKFITNFSLPALVFRALATINFDDVNWSLIAGIFFAKAILFVAVSLLTLVLTKGNECGKAGLYGIFCTQSNDFAVGFPLLESLYSGGKLDLAKYVYLLAPVQLLMINPFGLLMMELQKFWHSNVNRDETTSRKCLFLHVCRGVLTNPVVVMTMVGILWNIAFQRSVPEVIDSFLETLAKAFSATALFLLGLNLVGKIDIIHRSDVLYMPIMLTTAKLIILPFILRIIVEYSFVRSNDTDRFEASNFAFLYGTFPTAPTPFVFALQYDMDTTAVATGMAISTIAAAPLMYVSATMVKVGNTSSTQYFSELGKSVSIISVISLVCVIWVLFIFFVDKRWKSVTHRLTIPLLFSQLMVAFGGLLWYMVDENNSFNSYHFQYLLTVGGLFSCRIWYSVLAVTLALLYWKGLHFTRSLQIRIIVFTFLLNICLMIAVMLFPDYPKLDKLNPAFELGILEKWISIILLTISTLIVTISLVTQHYFDEKNSLWSDNQGLHRNDSGIEEFDANVEEVISINDDTEQSVRRREVEENCTSSEVCTLLTNCVQTTDLNAQFEIKEHLILVLVANIAMFVTLMVSIDNMIVDENSGIFIELQYISVVVNYGQVYFEKYFVVIEVELKIIPYVCHFPDLESQHQKSIFVTA
ncbi:integral membrane protein GPR155-like protein [Leptotrombidium deliense]|uniref:Integral membrane protein GPR155-like protein n=1 Tax=Leptotrombidium deliense TaxID=299467 RepID=A0A443SLG5_9ACAR|nr:integral membrane protein GPR155-like protein [Leptotrombidium deliense]